jgi:O-antigen/teichoic acid export membrane protein
MKSLVYIALGWLAPIVVFLVGTPMLVGALGFAGFGVFALAATLVAAAATIDLGFNALAVRDLARRRQDPEAFRRHAAGLHSIFAALGGTAVVVVWSLSAAIARRLNWDQALAPADAVAAVRWAGLWLGLAFCNAGLASSLRAAERFGALTLLASGALAATWAAAVAAAYAGLGAADAVALAAGIAAVQTVFAAAMQARVFGRWPGLGQVPCFDPGAARFAAAAFLNQATSLATYHADKAIVSGVLGAAPAGIYVAAANIANKPLAFVATLASILFPRIAALESQGRAFRSARTYLAASRMLAAASTLMAACGLVLAADFVRLWLGDGVPEDVATAFRILLVAYWLAALSVAPSNALAGQGNMHRGAVFALAGGVVTLALCVLLVPRFGIVGAAVAGLAGMSQAAVFELWAHREAQARIRILRLRLRRTLAALAAGGGAAAAATALVVRTLPAGWVALAAAAAAGVAAFVAVWFGLRLAVREERVLLARLLRWIGVRH